MIALAGLALAAPWPEDAPGRRLSGPLRDAWQAARQGRLDALRARVDLPDPDGVSVVADGDIDLPARAGWVVEAATEGHVQLWVPYGDLADVAALSGARQVRLPFRARPKATSEGYAAVMATDWHDSGLTGAGVRVGVVDVGFAGHASLLGEELPDEVETDFSRGSKDATDHGTAVAEVIHDFAPQATLSLATFATDVEFGEVIEQFLDDGIQVVNGSIGFDNVWHADGTSSLAQYVDNAVEDGMIYIAAAGNENDKYRVGELTDGGGGAVALAGVVESWCYAGGFPNVSLRWSEPFGQAREDLDLALYNEDGTECGRSATTQAGQDYPYEIVSASGCSEWVAAVVENAGSADIEGLTGFLYCYEGVDETLLTHTQDLTLPGDNHDAITVGAYYAADDSIAYYSSRGPTDDGRTKPDVVAPTGVTTATYGRHNFEGSSAAAPHAAGLAALWVDATGSDDPAKLKAWMMTGARDLGEPGEDDVFGAGAIVGDEIPAVICECGTGRPSAGWLAVAGAMALIRRRR